MEDNHVSPHCGSSTEHSTEYVMIGVLVGCIASVASNFGVNLQKYSFMMEERKPLAERMDYTQQWRWWGGMCLVILAAILDVVSFALAPQSLVAPTGALSPVSNVVFAVFFLGEGLQLVDLAGTGLVVIGGLLALSFGARSYRCFTLPQLKALYLRAPMIMYLLVVGGAVLYMHNFTKSAEHVLASSQAAKETEARILEQAGAIGTGADRRGRAASAGRQYRGGSRSLGNGGASPGLGVGEHRALAPMGAGGAGGRDEEKGTLSVTNSPRRRGSSATGQSIEQIGLLASSEGPSEHSAGITGQQHHGQQQGNQPSSDPGNGASAPAAARGNSSRMLSASENTGLEGAAAGGASSHSSHLSAKEEKARKLAVLRGALQMPPAAYQPFARLHPVFYGTLAALVGAQTVVFAKSVTEIVKTTVRGENQFVYWMTYLLIAGTGVSIVGQQHYMARGLQMFDSLLVVPVFSAIFMAATIVSGGIYFKEFEGFTAQQAMGFPCGVLLTLAGVYVLSGRQAKAASGKA